MDSVDGHRCRDNSLAWAAVENGQRQIGVRYLWGGKTPDGWDCSGLVCDGLQATGKLKNGETLSSQGLYRHFDSLGAIVGAPQCGCLVFYGGGAASISHVAVCIDETYMVEAGGGDSRTVTLRDAIKKRAFVRRRAINRRDDIVGYADPYLL